MLPRVLAGITETEKICRRRDACHSALCVSPRAPFTKEERKGVPILPYESHSLLQENFFTTPAMRRAVSFRFTVDSGEDQSVSHPLEHSA